jgi:hypothetical protein
MALKYRLDAISQGPKNSRFPGPNPLPLAAEPIIIGLSLYKAFRIRIGLNADLDPAPDLAPDLGSSQ